MNSLFPWLRSFFFHLRRSVKISKLSDSLWNIWNLQIFETFRTFRISISQVLQVSKLSRLKFDRRETETAIESDRYVHGG